MKKSPRWLLEHKRNVYSQTGEDGIIEKILDVLPQTDKWCVEFGAWDGITFSNTRHLIESKHYAAVLIEADKKKFSALKQNYAARANVIPINRFVGFGADDNLDRILGTTPIPRDFDFLSIDIDGNDYHCWNATIKYAPKVVVIEFNQTIPTEVRFVQEQNFAVTQSASLLALVELGRDKGYELVCVLEFNAFFVRREYFPLFELESNAPEILRPDLSQITYLFSGQDGQILLGGYGALPWHGIPILPAKIQPLPKFLRTSPYSYTRAQQFVFALFLLFNDPRRLWRKISKCLTR